MSDMYVFICFRYIPVLMAQAKIYWDLDNYAQVEKASFVKESFWVLFQHNVFRTVLLCRRHRMSLVVNHNLNSNQAVVN